MVCLNLKYVQILLRKCWKCQLEKPPECFSKDRTKHDGLAARCKECDKFFSKRYKERNPNYFVEKGKETYAIKSVDPDFNKNRYKNKRDRYLKYNERTRQEESGCLYMIWQSAKERAKSYEREFTITREWVKETFDKQNGKCALTGISFDFKKHETLRRCPWRPSIDRIDCAKGYTPDNCRIICVMMNLALCDFGEESFRLIAEGFLKTNPKPHNCKLDSKHSDP